MNLIKEYWNNALSLIENEVTKISYSTWIEPIKPHKISGDTFYLFVPDTHAKTFIEPRLGKLIKNCINMANSINYEVSFVCPEDLENEELNINDNTSTSSENAFFGLEVTNSVLNEKYVFDNFVIGNGNRLAHAGAVAVAETPAAAYNPLFIYGGSGLGKTHLMHAIGNHIKKTKPNARVLYVASEVFTNELINAIKDDKTTEFKNKYRNVDVLMLDDVQFIGGKVRTEEEFFHTFNALYEANKQIVLTSDKPPKEIATLEERLRSRFAWGLIADIQPPDLETRVAILKKKIEQERIQAPDDVLLYIASNVETNIRDLEGALNKLVAYCTLLGAEINVECAQKVLNDMFHINKNKSINCKLIINSVSRYFDIGIDEILGKKRNKEIAFPRQIAMYLCRILTDTSLPKIGEYFNRDHSTILHAVEKISDEASIRPELKQSVEELKKIILG